MNQLVTVLEATIGILAILVGFGIAWLLIVGGSCLLRLERRLLELEGSSRDRSLSLSPTGRFAAAPDRGPSRARGPRPA